MTKKDKISKETQDKIRNLLANGESQDNISRELNIPQASLSRYIKEYHLHPYDECDLSELLKGLSVSAPSVFFIDVPIAKRSSIANKLLADYGETATRYGIVSIQEIKHPRSGLLIFSNDHNLMHILNDMILSQ